MLILAELGKKFPPFYGTKKFIILTTVCIWIMSGSRWIQPTSSCTQ
jgi:hypothetical protein